MTPPTRSEVVALIHDVCRPPSLPRIDAAPEVEQRGDVNASLGCMVCGARGFEPCSLSKHAASIVGFAAWMTREKRIEANKLAGEVTP